MNEFLKMIESSNVIPSRREMNYLVEDFEGSIVDDVFLNDPLVGKL